MTATIAYDNILSHAESIKNDEPQRVETWSRGDAWPQGDVLFVCLDRLPGGAVKIENPQVQLAPGTTQGSRHCLDSLDGITQYRLPSGTPLDGPILQAERQFTVTHPEHGDVSLPAGYVGVVYQRQFAEELRRAAD